MRILFILLFTMLLAACCERVKTPSTENSPIPLALFSQRDAVVDAKAALAAGDTRLWAYYGRAGLTAPGVSDVDSNNVRLVEGMGDVITDDTQLVLREAFVTYAERYNHIVLNASDTK